MLQDYESAHAIYITNGNPIQEIRSLRCYNFQSEIQQRFDEIETQQFLPNTNTSMPNALKMFRIYSSWEVDSSEKKVSTIKYSEPYQKQLWPLF